MAETILNKRKCLKERADDFLTTWHRFPIDYWWRKKYNVAFGSSQHREMNLIDMFIEYREELNMLKSEKEELQVGEQDDRIIQMSQEQIDDEYENIDLDQFD